MILKGWKAIGKTLGVHHCTARRWLKLYAMPVSYVGRTVLIDDAALIKWIEKHQREIQENPAINNPLA